MDQCVDRNSTARTWLGWAAALGELTPLHLRSAAADGAKCGKACEGVFGTHSHYNMANRGGGDALRTDQPGKVAAAEASAPCRNQRGGVT